MKKAYEYSVGNKRIKKEINYIPFRYILAILITVFEIAVIIGIVTFLCYKVPYFYLLAFATQIACVVKIIASDDNPDYKVPWLLFVLILPIAGFMLYMMVYSRILKKKYIKRLVDIDSKSYKKDDTAENQALSEENPVAFAQAKMLCRIADCHVFKGAGQKYYSLGESMYHDMLNDIKKHSALYLWNILLSRRGNFGILFLMYLRKRHRRE